MPDPNDLGGPPEGVRLDLAGALGVAVGALRRIADGVERPQDAARSALSRLAAATEARLREETIEEKKARLASLREMENPGDGIRATIAHLEAELLDARGLEERVQALEVGSVRLGPQSPTAEEVAQSVQRFADEVAAAVEKQRERATGRGAPSDDCAGVPTCEKLPDGQFKDHWVLPEEERAKGFVRPVLCPEPNHFQRDMWRVSMWKTLEHIRHGGHPFSEPPREAANG